MVGKLAIVGTVSVLVAISVSSTTAVTILRLMSYIMTVYASSCSVISLSSVMIVSLATFTTSTIRPCSFFNA